MIEAERHVPRLAGEDHQHRRQFETDVARRENRVEGQQQAGQEAEDGDALEDVEQRDEDAFRSPVVSSPVAVDERETEQDAVGDQAARQRVERVARQRPR